MNKIVTKYSAAYSNNFDKIQRDKSIKKETGKFYWHPERKEWVRAHEMPRHEDKRSKLNVPAIHVFKPYNSPLDGRLIHSPNQERDHLARNNCRIYEGFEQEEKVAKAERAEMDKKAEQDIADSVRKTYHGLKNKMIKPEDANKTLNILDE